MSFQTTMCVSLLCLLIGCKPSEIKRIPINGQIAEGVFLPGNVFNGRINFYDSATKKLVETGTYKNGVADGESTTFYPDGNIRTNQHYSNGKVYGFVSSFDSLENITTTQYRYYDLRVGPSVDYRVGEPVDFWYYSFDQDLLFHINYDSVLNRKITDITKDYFFLIKSQYWEKSYRDHGKLRDEYFIYLINPPKYNFQYSFCIIDNSYQVIREIKKFDARKIWDTFEIDSSQLENGYRFAVKLGVEDSLHESNGIMKSFKIIKN